jgi:hypothetical protein
MLDHARYADKYEDAKRFWISETAKAQLPREPRELPLAVELHNFCCLLGTGFPLS